jgi:hypothetical protein
MKKALKVGEMLEEAWSTFDYVDQTFPYRHRSIGTQVGTTDQAAKPTD